MSAPDLSTPIFTALKNNSGIASALPTYEGGPAIITRRPVPNDVPYPMIVSAGDVTVGDQDLLDDSVVVIVRDVAIYGQQDAKIVSKYRTVESLGRMVRDLFHRQRNALTVPGWSVVDIVCSGPFVGPTDDTASVARIVTLTVRLSPA